MLLIELITNTKFYLLVKKNTSGEIVYCLKDSSKEDDIRLLQGKNRQDPIMSQDTLARIISLGKIDSYLVGATKKDIKGIDSSGDCKVIKLFYDILKANNLMLNNLRFNEEGISLRYLADTPNYRIPANFDKKELWYVNTNLISSVNAFRTLSELESVRDLKFLKKKDYRMVTSISQLKDYAKNELLYAKVPCIDYEATGLEFGDHDQCDKVVSIQFSWMRDQGIFIPVWMDKMDNLPVDEVFDILRECMENNGMSAHNAMYEKKVSYHYKTNLKIVHDSIILLHRMKPAECKLKLDLKTNTLLLYGDDTLHLRDVTGSQNETLFRYCDPDVALAYGCPDTDYGFQMVEDILSNMNESNKVSEIYTNYKGDATHYKKLMKCGMNTYNNDIVMLNDFAVDEYYGIPCDKTLLKKEIDKEEKELEILEKEIYSFVGKQWYSQQELLKERMIGDIKKDTAYETSEVTFDISKPQQLKQVVFQVLKYPATKILEKSKEMSLAKPDFKEFLRNNLDVSNETFDDDILGVDNTPLIKKEELNFKKYPFIKLIQEFRDRKKNVTGFLVPMFRSIKNERMFTSYSFTRADTTRLIDRVQTLKKSLKKAVVSTKDEWVMVFDCAQEEIRIMCEMANFTFMIDKLNNPEKDAHREGCSEGLGKLPHEVTKYERTDWKNVAFGKPYMMGDESLLLQVKKPPFTEKDRQFVKLLSFKWDLTNRPIVNVLEAYRKMALDRGYVKNRFGRIINYDVWLDMSNMQKSKVKRQSGNSPIQSYGADYMRLVYNRLKRILREEGLEKKVRLPLNVHDEFVMFISRDVNKYHMYDIIERAAFTTGLNNMKYFWGLSIVDNWLEGKEDLYEAPANFVMEKAQEWRDGKHKDEHSMTQKEDTLADIKEYVNKRVYESFNEIHGKILSKEDIINLDLILDKWDNYFFRSRIGMYVGQYRKPIGEEDTEIPNIEKLFLDMWSQATFTYKGKIYTLTKTGEEIAEFILLEEKKKDRDKAEQEAYDQAVESLDEDEEDNDYASSGDDFKVIDPKGETIFDRVKFKGINTKTFSLNGLVIIEKDNSFVVPIDGIKKSVFEKLILLLNENPGDRDVVFQFNKKFIPTRIKVSTIKVEEINSKLNLKYEMTRSF